MILHADGYGPWPKHVGVLYIQKLVQFIGNELVYMPAKFTKVLKLLSFTLLVG
jgi:hypothetical protein